MASGIRMVGVVPVSVDGVINPLLPDSRTDQGAGAAPRRISAMMLVDPKLGSITYLITWLLFAGRPGKTVPERF